MFTEMDIAKRRALIRSNAAKNRTAKVMEPKEATVSAKRKQPSKGDRSPKKPKVPLEPVVGLMAEGAKRATPTKHGAGKGLMKGPSSNLKKPPPLLRDDPSYALEKLSSLLTSEDYEDLGNHSTEAMGETSLFSIAQVSPVYVMYAYSLSVVQFLISFEFFNISDHGHGEGTHGTVS